MKGNILYFCSVSKLDSGMPLSTLRLVKFFKDKYNVIVALAERGELSDELDKLGIKYQILNFDRLRRFRNAGELLAFLFKIFPAQWRLFRFIRANKIDIVHFSDLIDLPFFITAKITGAKVISHLRVILLRGAFIKKLYLWLVKYFANRVVCVSNAVKNGMFDKSNLIEKVDVVNDPIPKIDDMTNQKSVSEGSKDFIELESIKNDKNFKVCYISKFVKVKGHKNLLEVAKRIKGMGIKDVNYYVIGGQEKGHIDYFESFLEKMKEYELEDNIKLLGRLTHYQTMAILNECDILMHLPDYEEPFPGVVMEAFSLGKPVIAYRCGGIPELIESGKNGFIEDVGDFDRITKRVIELKVDCDKINKMGQVARENLFKNFNEILFKSKIENIYEELLKNRKSKIN